MKTKKTILITASVLTLSICSLLPAVNVSASSQNITTEQYGNSVAPRSDIKEWVYKIENGKKYKRLYNASTASWETDWIYIGDV